jgi:hypothetical protein
MRDDLAIVRDLVNSWERGNSLAVRASLDSRVVASRAGESRPRQGRDSVVATLEEWRTTLDAFSAGPVEVVRAGDTIVAHCQFRRGRNGAEQQIDETQIYRLTNGRVVAVHEYRHSIPSY